MDITVYPNLYNAVEKAIAGFNKTVEYKVALKRKRTTGTKYPLVVMTEPTNLPSGKYYGSRERISVLGYKFDIYAKDYKGKIDALVCREIMQFITDFMQNHIGLGLISNNLFPEVDEQGELCHIVLVFQRKYYENKETFI